MIVASSAGGGFDRSTRQIEPPMAKALGTKLNLEYQDAASGAVAMQILSKAKDCNTIASSANPKVILGQLIQKAGYDYQRDFVSAGGFTRDYPVLMVAKGSKWQDINSLVTYAKANPKGITVAVGSLASDGLPVIAFEQAAGVQFNVVPLGGGTEANNALLGDKAPVAESSVFNSLTLAGKVKVLTVMADSNPIPDKIDNAPMANQALGINLPEQVNNYGLFVSKACQQNYPEQYKKIVDALKGALEDADFKATVDKLGLTGWYVYTDPTQMDKEIIDSIPQLQKIVADNNLTGES
jgi:tripartite-type tricarboxylate transporter receptor subunit TctC